MSSEAIRDAVRTLFWSVFTELGVPGVVRQHQHAAIDPEPIIAVVPTFFELDPRLRDQVYGWCRAHAGRISVSRMRGLVGQLPDPPRHAFAAFAATLQADANVKWATEEATRWPRTPVVSVPPLPLQRPALLRLRLRTLCGVGARADVLSELLAHSGGWTRSSDLADLGYTKRSIAGILSDLSDAGLARSLPERNALGYQLARPELVRELAGATALGFPSWRRLMGLVLALVRLADLERKPDAVRRVEANAVRDELGPLAVHLGLTAPPGTRGNPRAWEDLMAWAASVAAELGGGTSSAFGAGNVRV